MFQGCLFIYSGETFIKIITPFLGGAFADDVQSPK